MIRSGELSEISVAGFLGVFDRVVLSLERRAALVADEGENGRVDSVTLSFALLCEFEDTLKGLLI